METGSRKSISREDLDHHDFALEDYIFDEIPITSDETVRVLLERYGGDEGADYLIHRGLNFETKEEYEGFIASLESNNAYVDHSLSSWSPKLNVAEGYAKCKKSYNNNEQLTILKGGEAVQGYQGIVMTASVDGAFLIDLDKAPFQSEREIILLPSVPVKTEIRNVIPFERIVSSCNDLDELVLVTSDDYLREYILNNHGYQLSEESVDMFFSSRLADFYHDRDTDSSTSIIRELRNDDLSSGLVKVADGYTYQTTEDSRSKTQNFIKMDSGEILVATKYNDTRSAKGYTELSAELPSDVIEMYENGLLSSVQVARVRKIVDAYVDSACRVIDDFGVTVLDKTLREAFVLFSSKEKLDDLFYRLSSSSVSDLNRIEVDFLSGQLQDSRKNQYGTRGNSERQVSKSDLRHHVDDFSSKFHAFIAAVAVRKGVSSETLKVDGGREVSRPILK